jgi:Uma2 family endonuclease
MGAAVPISVPADLPRRRLTVDDYHAMAEAGVLGEDDRVELIEGELIEMAPIGGGHMLGVNRLTHTLVHAVGDRAVVSVQNGLMLPPFSEPQPDFVLLPRQFLQEARVPTMADALLVIEVADTTVAKDRNVKAPLYARHGICEYWIVNLPRKVVQVFRQPGEDGYREVFERGSGSTVSPLALPDVAVDLTALFA